MKRMIKVKTILLLLITALLMTACVDKEKNKLDNRVLDFWNAKINKDYKAAYQFLSPGWKANEGEGSYIQRMAASRVKWVSAKIKSKNCSAINLCKIVVSIEYEYQFTGAFSKKITVPSDLQEDWIMKDNIWYFVPVETKLK